jgi:NADH-quinone oxidoreductase subunit H
MTPETKGLILLAIVKILVIFTAYMVGVIMVIWMERRISAWKQDRLGPNRVGPEGLLQGVADGIKNIMKEETFPTQANRFLFLLAPAMSFIPALLTFTVIPFAAPFDVNFDFALGPLGRFVHHGPMPVMVADLPIGLLFIVALSSLAVYGIVLSGWSSNSKYALLGGLRASAQMVSYEVALGMTLTTIFILAGNVTLSEIIAVQQQSLWFVFMLTLGFAMFAISALAETNRLPFDLPETESELVTGYHTEYSSMKFSMFFIAEYAHIITGASLITTLFFGGWSIPLASVLPFLPAQGTVLFSLLSLGSFFVKALFFVYCYIWIRWTLPRFRFDQLMQLGWKVLLPMAIGYILVIAAVVLVLDDAGVTMGKLYGLVLFGVNGVLVYLVFWIFDHNRLLEGAAHGRRRVEV